MSFSATGNFIFPTLRSEFISVVRVCACARVRVCAACRSTDSTVSMDSTGMSPYSTALLASELLTVLWASMRRWNSGSSELFFFKPS